MALVVALRDCGISVWLDQSDIPVCVPWVEEIAQGMRGVLVVVACQSMAWYASENCTVEWKFAESLHKPVQWVDVETLDVTAVVTQIRQHLSQVPPEERLRAELLAASQKWLAAGRVGSALASGRRLTQYRRLLGRTADSGDGIARQYVRLSMRRRRVRRARAVLAGTVTSLLVAGVRALPTLTSGPTSISTKRSPSSTRPRRRTGRRPRTAMRAWPRL